MDGASEQSCAVGPPLPVPHGPGRATSAAGLPGAAAAAVAVQAPPPPGARPLSAAQLPIWHAETLHRGTPRWTQVGVTTFYGLVDRPGLEAALAATVAAYPALRTRLLRRGPVAWQAFFDPAGFVVGRHDLSALPEAERGRRVAAFVAARERHRFRLLDGWLFGADVFACGPGRTVMVMAMHHIAADGLSFPLILRHVAAAFRGEAGAEVDPRYERWLDRQPHPAPDAALAFYRRSLAGAPLRLGRLHEGGEDGAPHEPPDLPESRCLLDASVVAGLARLAERAAATLFIVCLAAYGAALAGAFDAPDMVVGVYVGGRGGEAGLVAMATNLVLVRLRLDPGADAATLVGVVREAWRPVRRLEAVPIHDLRVLARERPALPGEGIVPDRVQVAINFLDLRGMACDLPGVVSHTAPPHSAVPFNDLMLLLFRGHEGLHLRLVNGSGARGLDAARLDGLLDRIRGILRAWSEAARQSS